jgi:2-phosphosulfolactate phosphatase
MAALSVEVIFLPRLLESHPIQGRSVVAFDVLRATTSITAALVAGVKEVRLFGDLESAACAAKSFGSDALLCGESACVAPPGFDLGNSPGAFQSNSHAGRTVFMATTNGTKALIAARQAQSLFAGALVNAAAISRELIRRQRPVTLLCAGTQGRIALEDVLGAGAVLNHLAAATDAELVGDAATISLELFRSHQCSLSQALENAMGGRNIIAAGLGDDIRFCAQLDALPTVGVVHDDPLRVVKFDL